jgi:hypothetical protein
LRRRPSKIILFLVLVCLFEVPALNPRHQQSFGLLVSSGQPYLCQRYALVSFLSPP